MAGQADHSDKSNNHQKQSENLNLNQINQDFVLYPLSYSQHTPRDFDEYHATTNDHLDSPLELNYSPASSNSPLFADTSFHRADYSPLNEYLTGSLFEVPGMLSPCLTPELEMDLSGLDLFEPLRRPSSSARLQQNEEREATGLAAIFEEPETLERVKVEDEDDDELPPLTPSPVCSPHQTDEAKMDKDTPSVTTERRQTRSGKPYASPASAHSTVSALARRSIPSASPGPIEPGARTKAGKRIFNGVRSTVFEVVELAAPVQARRYKGDTKTSRKRIPKAIEKKLPPAKRARLVRGIKASPPDEEDGDGEEDVKKEVMSLVEENRLKNTLAARVSRLRKAEYLQGLVDENERLKRENGELKMENDKLRRK